MVGLKIKEYLDENGIKYSYLSEKTGMPMNILSPTLNGKRKMSAEEYFMICGMLGLPAETFAPDTQDDGQEQKNKNTDRSAIPTSILPNLFTLCTLQVFTTLDSAKRFYEILCHFRSFGSAECLSADK